MNADDRRVRKTKRALQRALAEAMADKDLRSITVQELADRADIHRATFYAHYHDVYDLYEQLENSVMSELDKIIASDPKHRYDGIYEAVTDYVFENPALFRMLLGANGNARFQNHAYELVENKYLDIWLFEDHRTEISDEMRFLTAYHIQGCIAIISQWVNGNFSRPKEEIVELMRRVGDSFEQTLAE